MPIEYFLNNHELEKKKDIKSEKYNGNDWKHCLYKNFKHLRGRKCPKESQIKQ